MKEQEKPKSEERLAELMRAACNGDQQAYRTFLLTVSPIIRGVIRAKAGGLPNETQEDILQDVLFAIHSKRDTWRQDHPIKPWFYAIARYKIIDAFRSRGRADFVDIDDFSDSIAAPQEEEGSEMDTETLVTKLPKKQQTVVRLIAIDGLSIKDAALKLDMKETAVRVNFHRALERLRELGKE